MSDPTHGTRRRREGYLPGDRLERVNRRQFIDPTGATSRVPQRIVAERPGHMVHIDVKQVGRIPDGGGWNW